MESETIGAIIAILVLGPTGVYLIVSGKGKNRWLGAGLGLGAIIALLIVQRGWLE